MKVCTDSCLFGAWAAKQISTTTKSILDVGTGTGLLSLMVQQQLPLASILGIDVDANAIEQATENTASYPNIAIQKANVLQLEEKQPFDAIICNPPFYENQLQSPNQTKTLAHHASELSHKQLAKKIATLLDKNGQAFILLPYINYEKFISYCQQNGLYATQTALVKQTPAHPYFRAMIEFSFNKSTTIKEEYVCIKNEENAYSKEFVSYLKGYYLYL